MLQAMLENLDKLCQMKENQENQQHIHVGCKWRYKQLKYSRHRIEASKVIELADDSEPELEDEKKHRCDFDSCEKAYKSWFNLQRHRALHYKAVDSKPYLCDWQECHAQFKKLKNLIVHRRLHTGLRPFKCDFPKCKKEFRSAHSLSSHRRRHEKDDSPEPIEQ